MDQAAILRERFKSQQPSDTNSQKNMEAKTIAVVSGKGGVGKSNFSLNFSITLSQKGNRVLLVDMDLGMGNIDILMGDSPSLSLYDFLNDEAELKDLIFKGPENLSYMAAGTAFQSFKRLDGFKLRQFVTALETLSTQYDYMIFDMGAGATEESISLLFSVDDCIVITTPEPTAITDAYSMTKHLIVQKAPVNLHLICNRTKSSKDGVNTLSRLQSAITKFLQSEVRLLGSIPDDDNVQRAVIYQTPFVLYRPTSTSSIALKEITETYVNGSPKSASFNESTKQPGFLKKLRHYFLDRKGSV
ncbi:flagellum location/number ATPase FlhG [Bacillus carboniphilus]|uniref:Flagellum location/number ATPase FlhG n=1 Tax=Bacillus carboniphilus TaxID=86663 RepID=A0ABN0WBK8_9BACI